MGTLVYQRDLTIKEGNYKRYYTKCMGEQVGRQKLIDVFSVGWMVVWSSLWFASLYIAYNYPYFYVPFITIPVATFCSFMLFVISHDTVHGAFSSIQIINEICGRFATIFLYPAPWSAWRHMHNLHHKYTNNPDKDPDYWATHSERVPPVLRAAAQGYIYIYYYAVHCTFSRPIFEVTEFYLLMSFYAFLPYWFYTHGLLGIATQQFIIPAFLGLVTVAYFLDVLPHSGNMDTPQSDPYKTTSFIKPKNHQTNPLWYSFLMQYQDYHFIHHLNPKLCFHEHIPKYFSKKEFYDSKDVPVVNFM